MTPHEQLSHIKIVSQIQLNYLNDFKADNPNFFTGTMKNFVGVSFNRQKQKWVSKINNIDCGYYDNQIDAVRARDLAIIKQGLPLSKLQILKKKL